MGPSKSTRRIADLTTLLDVSRRLGATTELVPLLERITEAATSVLDCDRATVFLYDASAHELYSKAATGVDEIRFSANAGIAGECVREGTIINVPDAYADVRFNREVDRGTGYRTRSLLTFPMRGHRGDLVGVLQVLNKAGGPFTGRDEELAGILSSLAGVAVQRQMLLDEFAEKQKLERDLGLAREIQQSLLPQRDPVVPGFDIAGFNRPADATGGDCYDYLELPDGRLGFILADATGHGIGPALVVSQFRAMIHALLQPGSDLAEVVGRVNDLLDGDIPDGMFVTAIVGLLDSQTNAISYISGGQGPLLLYRKATDTAEERAADTCPLGIISPLAAVEPTRLELAPGDVFLLLTDGFFEWANPNNQQFGTEPVFEIVRQHPDATAAELIRQVRTALDAHAQGTAQKDDLTAIVIKRR